MDIGLFLTFEHPSTPAADLYAGSIDIVIQAEELALASVWVVQQHFSPDYGRLPAPLPFLAAAGQHTSRISLGTAVIALTFEHPLSLAASAVVTDTLVGGRLRLGLGTGDQDAAFVAFGLDPDTRRRRFRSQLAKLLTVLEGRPGIAGTVLHPPLGRPADDLIWLAAQGGDTAVLAGRHDLGLLQGRVEPGGVEVVPHQRRTVAAYRDAGGRRVTVARSVWLTDHRVPEADPELAEALSRYHASSSRRKTVGPIALSVPDLIRRFHVLAGTPDVVAARLREDLAGIDPDELILTLDPGGLPPDRLSAKVAWAASDLVPALI